LEIPGHIFKLLEGNPWAPERTDLLPKALGMTNFPQWKSTPQNPALCKALADPELEGGRYHGDNKDYEETFPPLRPNRKRDVVIDSGGQRLTVNNLSQHNVRAGNVNPMIHNYTSPIGLSFIAFLFL
jgi:hypothetical protein